MSELLSDVFSMQYLFMDALVGNGDDHNCSLPDGFRLHGRLRGFSAHGKSPLEPT